MKNLPVGELKAQFSEVLDRVRQGESYGILYGKQKRPVAMIVPFREVEQKSRRRIGLLDGQVTITFADDFEMTEDELVGLT